jgi:TonB family protein
VRLRLFTLLVLVAGVSAAGCGTQNASVGPPSVVVPPPCSLRLGQVDPLTGTAASAQTYALALETTQAVGSTVAGTLTLYVGDDRYTAHVQSAVVASRGASDNTATPVVVRFAAPVHLDHAYLSSLESPSAVSCGVGNVWSAPQSSAAPAPTPIGQPAFDQAAFDALAASEPASPAVLAAHETPPPCAQPYASAQIVHSTQPDYPEIAVQEGAQGTVVDEITLTTSGAVANADVYSSSGFKVLDDAAMLAAGATTYRAETFRCASVYGVFFFSADFVSE